MTTKAVSIENYPGFSEISSTDLIGRFEQHLDNLGVEIELAEVREVEKDSDFVVKTKESEFESKAVIIATGADPRPLEVPGEKKLIGRGVSYCAICDGPLYKDKKVVVVGGGDAGFESALFLSQYAADITILEYGSEVKAGSINRQRVDEKDSIEVRLNSDLKRIEGEEFVESIIYKNRETEQEKEMEVEGVFIEIGRQPATSFVNELVEFNEKDEIKVDRDTCMTKTGGLFAAGDVTNVKFKQIVIAAGEGAKAALGAYQYLQ